MYKIQKMTFIFLLITLGFSNSVFGQLEKIAEGFQFVEGPVWKDGRILFSDIPANRIYSWSKTNGKRLYHRPSGNSNGLALDTDGNLLMAQHGNRRIAKLDSNGIETPIATHYNSKRLNSPNDMAVKSDGSIFFTDPPYGINSSQSELGFNGIYRVNLNGTIQLLDKTLYRPNGITFSPDEKLLYVTDSEARDIYVWDVVDDTTISNKRLFFHINQSGYTDGLKVNSQGRLFVTGPVGVWIFDPDGTVVETISVPGQTSNCNWGDEDGNTLYITSGNAVYKYRSELTDIEGKNSSGEIQNSFKLFNNYPNPFNPTTKISYSIPATTNIKLAIYDILGNEITTLVDEIKSSGTHSVNLSAYNFSSGTYIYRLIADNFTDSKKMILLK